MLAEMSNRLILRFDPGQFTFNHFFAGSNDESLHELANALNKFQEDELKRVLKVQVFELL